MNRNSATKVLEILLADPGLASSIRRVESMPARPASWSPLPLDLHPGLRAALEKRGVSRLYSHQARAYELGRENRDFVVLTPTASGKTLCYNLPVLQCLMEKPQARALYLFPTKALSQDQQAELGGLCAAGELPLPVFTYDGDSPASLRSAARDQGRIIVSNPDMLHAGILPNHTKWIHFFANLRYVVVDEMHAYRGVFGSHVANVLRRFMRIAAFYKAFPSFILSSATIGNPEELASALIGRTVAAIRENGAPLGERRVVFYNPPLVDASQGIRRSSAAESEKIALRFLRGGVKTILFARSRLRVELIASYITKSLANPYTDNEGITVRPYRSGLLPSERRAIEKGLREGSIQGVVSTNALELGIDIGGLGAAVIAGFPGSFAAFWQQAGRAGRRNELSVAVLVASSAPLDQYILAHPEYFFGRTPECARIDPDNPYIFTDHLKCAAFELPFSEGEAFGAALDMRQESQAQATSEALAMLAEAGIVRLVRGRWYWSAEGYPAEAISLRSAVADNIVIVDETNGGHSVIGEMDRPSAKELIFDDAVYIHMGRQYIVLKLDLENKVCHVVEREVDFWTDAVVKTDIELLSEDERGRLAGVETLLGDVLVRSEAEKYKKLRFHTHENIGYGEIHLPPEEMQTRALVMLMPSRLMDRMSFAQDEALKAAVLSGAARLIHDIAPAFLMCDPADIGKSARVRDPHFALPALYFYDRYPGGTGLAEGLAGMLPKVVAAAGERLALCPCAFGCPSCIGVDFLGEDYAFAPRPPIDGAQVKAGVLEFFGSLSGAEDGL